MDLHNIRSRHAQAVNDTNIALNNDQGIPNRPL